MAINILKAFRVAAREVKEYIDENFVSHESEQTLDEASRTTAKNNVGVYVSEAEPVDALDGDIWVDTTEDAIVVSNVHIVDIGGNDLSSIDFSKYAAGDIILVTASS